MRHTFMAALLAVGLLQGQWLEQVVAEPDTFATLSVPQSLTYNPAAQRIYIGARGGVLVLDPATRQLVARYDLPGYCFLCYDEGRDLLCCLSRGPNRLYQLDGSTGRVFDSLQLPAFPDFYRYSSRERKLYTATYDSAFVQVIDCATNAFVARIDHPRFIRAMFFCPELNRLFISSHDGREGTSVLSVVDGKTDSVLTTYSFPGDTALAGMCYVAGTNRVYCNADPGTVLVLDGSSNAIVRRISIPDCEEDLPEICFNPTSNRLFCGGAGGVVYIIDVATEEVVGRADVTRIDAPGLIVAPRSNRVYVADVGNCWCMCRTLDVLDGTDGTLLTTFGPLYIPESTCWDPVGDVLYCVNSSFDELLAVDCRGDTLLDAPVTASQPAQFCFDADYERLYVVHEAQLGIGVIDTREQKFIGRTILPGHVVGLLLDSTDNRLFAQLGRSLTQREVGVAVIDRASGELLRQLPVRGEWFGLVPSAHKAYCGSYDSVLVIDTRSLAVVGAVPLPRWSGYDAPLVSDRLRRLYVPAHDSLFVVDATHDRVVAAWPGEFVPLGINEELGLLYVRHGSQLEAVDESTGATVASLTLAAPSWRDLLEVNPVQRLVYYAAEKSGRVSILDASTLAWRGGVELGKRLAAMRCNPITNRLSCVDTSGSAVFIDGNTGQVTARIQCPRSPGAMTIDANAGRTYVGSYPGRIAVIRDSIRFGEQPIRQSLLNRADSLTVFTQAQVFNTAGRKVADLLPGNTSLRCLPSGVYVIYRPDRLLRRRVVVLH